MTDGRHEAIERAIAELEAQGLPVSNANVYSRVRGNHGEISRYLRDRRARLGGGVAVAEREEESPEEAAPLTPAEQYHTLKADYDSAYSRLETLMALARPTETQIAEQIVLEKLLTRLAPEVQRLEAEMVYAREDLHIAEFVDAYDADVQDKRAWFAHFAQCLAALAACIEQGRRLHNNQELLVMSLPQYIQERWNFPDSNTWTSNLASRFPDGVGQALMRVRSLTLGEMRNIMDADAGCRELNPRLIARYQDERKPAWTSPNA